MNITKLHEMRENMAELSNQYSIRRLNELREVAILEMLNLRTILVEKPNN